MTFFSSIFHFILQGGVLYTSVFSGWVFKIPYWARKESRSARIVKSKSNKSGSSAECSVVRKPIIFWDMYSIIVQILRISVSFNFNESFITLFFCSLESTSERLITFEMAEQRRNYFGPESSGPQRYPDWLKNGKSYRGRSAKYGHS